VGIVGETVARIERDRVSGSHAVFFVTLADGRECVLRVATHPEHDLARELWAAEQRRAAGFRDAAGIREVRQRLLGFEQALDGE
jgi:hypothetical protein